MSDAAGESATGAGLAARRRELLLALRLARDELGFWPAASDWEHRTKTHATRRTYVRTFDTWVGGSQVLVPQRVDAEKPSQDVSSAAAAAATAARQGVLVAGADDFEKVIAGAPESARPMLLRLCNWARALEAARLANLFSYQGTSGRWTLLPRLPAEGAGLVTIWNDGDPYISVWRSVFDRCAPLSLPKIEQLISPDRVGQGNTTHRISDELPAGLTDAYREANQH